VSLQKLRVVLLVKIVCGTPVGRDSSVGIATRYEMDGPGTESRWGEFFRTSPDRSWGPPSLLYNGYRVFPGGRVLPGRDADPSPPSAERESRAIPLLSLRAFVACERVKPTYLPTYQTLHFVRSSLILCPHLHA